MAYLASRKEFKSNKNRVSMFTVILVLIMIAAVTIFSVQNAMPVAISFLFWRFEASLAIVIFLSALCGIIIGAITASLLRARPRVGKANKSDID